MNILGEDWYLVPSSDGFDFYIRKDIRELRTKCMLFIGIEGK
jgi:hypothetical protein